MVAFKIGSLDSGPGFQADHTMCYALTINDLSQGLEHKEKTA